MQKRICPHCFTRWYSCAYNSEVWKCQSCGHDIPVPKDGDEIADCDSRTFQDIQRTDKVNQEASGGRCKS